MQHTAIATQTTTHDLSSNDLLNIGLTAFISADELTPIAFSKSHLFSRAKYGLFVEILCDNGSSEDRVVYTVRKATKNGYDRIIEEDSCYESIQDIWTIYANG